MAGTVRDGMLVTGVASVTAGAWQFHPGAGLIALGVQLLALAVVWARAGGDS